ncbi:unnamed protein product [Euphydryas editha]|uniref:Uncharacterized protein n=1 Tax=Euphydryas editha TaxID=104508 RepID=A0AAU9VE10_EUPED|nr:unnamed protein product [Euphydryas editha]
MTGRRYRDEKRDNSRRCRHDRSNSRSRSQLPESSLLPKCHDRSVSNRTPTRRDGSRHNSYDRTLDLILARFTAIKSILPGPSSSNKPSYLFTGRHAQLSLLSAAPVIVEGGNASAPETVGTVSCNPVGESISAGRQENAVDRIVGVLQALSKVRSQNYYISPFVPNVHNFDVCGVEVDRAKEINNWDDRECLGRVRR